MAAQPGRHAGFIHRLQRRRNPRLAEILLRQDVGRDLRPGLRHFDIGQAENHRSIRVANLARRADEFDLAIPALGLRGQFPLEAHAIVLFQAGGARRRSGDDRADNQI
jgi:hypothetical protein